MCLATDELIPLIFTVVFGLMAFVAMTWAVYKMYKQDVEDDIDMY